MRADDQIEIRQIGMTRGPRHRIPAGLPDLGQDRRQGMARVQKVKSPEGHKVDITALQGCCQQPGARWTSKTKGCRQASNSPKERT